MTARIATALLVGGFAFVLLWSVSQKVFADLQENASNSQRYAERFAADMSDDPRCAHFADEIRAHAAKQPDLNGLVIERIIRTRDGAKRAGCVPQ